MRQQRYFPSPVAEQTRWLQNFRHKLPAYQSALGIASDELAAIVADAGYLSYVLGSWQGAVRAFTRSTSSAVDEVLRGEGTPALPVFQAPPLPEGVTEVPNGALGRIFRFVRRTKLAAGYTEAIGTDLGLTGSGEGPERSVPRFELKSGWGATGPVVEIAFFSYGHQGVFIESQRTGEAVETLGVGGGSSYEDQRPLRTPGQPEVRSYRLRFWDKGEPNGEWTLWREITVTP